MATCKCFRCGRAYQSEDPEAVEGFEKCNDCIELSKKIAIRVDLEMEKRRRENPSKYDNPRAKLIQDLLNAPEGTRINARDLGIL